jgi:hypothetical protein
MGWFVKFLNATVGLDTSPVTDLGYELEPSPLLEGAFVVVNNPPPTTPQYVAVTTMLVIFTVCLSRFGFQKREYVWSVGLLASCFHNVDNILRPGTYFTPYWIVEPKIAFAMDQGFLLWIVVLVSGVLALRYLDTGNKKTWTTLVLLHSLGTSFGIAHYVAQAPSKFSWMAHLSISFEVIMGMLVGWQLFTRHRTSRQISQHARDDSVPLQDRSVSMEMPSVTSARGVSSKAYRSLRQRSKSPRI